MTVSVAEVERWKPGDVREVFHAARSRWEAAVDARDGIATLPAFGSWGGDAAEAARRANERLRVDLDAQGNESLAVATAARTAADDMQRVKDELGQLQSDVNGSGGAWQIDPVTSRVVPGPKPRVPLSVAVAEGANCKRGWRRS